MDSRPRPTIKEYLAMAVLILFVGFAACDPFFSFGLFFTIFGHVFAGWAFFLYRVLPIITLNWTGVLTTVLCMGLLTAGVHRFGNWFYAQVQKKRQAEVLRPWRWRWTICLLTVFVLMFVAGIAAVGITHQTVWLVTSPKPIIDERPNMSFGKFNVENTSTHSSATKPAAQTSSTPHATAP